MKKFVFRSSLFLLLLYAFLWPVGFWLDTYNINIVANKLTWTFNVKNSNFDDVFIGSSRTYMMFNHNIWNERTGRKAINLGLDGSGMADHLLTMHEFLRNGNSTKRVFLHIDHGTIANSFTYPFRDYIWALKAGDPIVKRTVEQEIPAIDFYILTLHPIGKYLRDRRKLAGFSVPDSIKSNFDQNAGTYYHEIKFKINHTKLDTLPFIPLIVSPSFLRNFESFQALLNAHNIELILYTAPLHPAYRKIADIENTILYLDSLAKENKIRWLNFYTLELEPDSLFYRDITHLNRNGTKVFTALIADSIRH